jgi:hypothetical protein
LSVLLQYTAYGQTTIYKKSLKILKGGNQNPYIEEQTRQWPKEKVQKVQTTIYKKSLKILKGGNQNPYIEEQTPQWSKEKVQKDKQRSTRRV